MPALVKDRRDGCVFLTGMTCRLCRVDCSGIGSVWVFRSYLALPGVICAGQWPCRWFAGGVSGTVRRCRFR